MSVVQSYFGQKCLAVKAFQFPVKDQISKNQQQLRQKWQSLF